MGVVIAILGGILKWIFLILLGLLGLVLVLLLIVLLTPLRYRVQGEKSAEKTEAKVKVTWLLHLFSFQLAFQNQKLTWKAKIGPKTLASYPTRAKLKEKPKAETKPQPVQPDDTPQVDVQQKIKPPQAEKTEVPQEEKEAVPQADAISPGENAKQEPETETMSSVHLSDEESADTAAAAPENRSCRQKVQAVCWKIRRFFEKVLKPVRMLPQAWHKLQDRAASLLCKWEDIQKLWDSYPQKGETVRSVGRLVCGLLKVPLPKRYDLQVRFGFEDPAATGKVLGYYYMLWPLLFPRETRGRRLEVTADFENPGLEASGRCKGHFSIGSFLLPVLRALMDPHIRRLIRYVRATMRQKNKKENA